MENTDCRALTCPFCYPVEITTFEDRREKKLVYICSNSFCTQVSNCELVFEIKEPKMTIVTTPDEVKGLHQKLTDCLNTVELGVAGRFVYYDKELNMFILAVHTTGPEKAHEATETAFKHIYGTESSPNELGMELQRAGIGFAGKQI